MVSGYVSRTESLEIEPTINDVSRGTVKADEVVF